MRKLLILTQKVDATDPVLGFFHRWIEAFAAKCEKVSIICLEEGKHTLPHNVSVYSLGKERGNSKLGYVLNFYAYIWRLRREYDTVFVHMNQEYVTLGWKLWKLMGKKIWLWRNHARGGFLTRCAVWVSDRVFSTSRASYAARFAKTEIMPAGIDTDFFHPDPSVARVPNSILFLGRISPVKKVLEFVEWAKEKEYKVTLAGPVPKIDEGYWQEVQSKMTSHMTYVGPVNQEQARKLYQSHEMYANFTPPGSFDKTIFEAAACGARLVTENPEAEESALHKDNSLNALVAKLAF